MKKRSLTKKLYPLLLATTAVAIAGYVVPNSALADTTGTIALRYAVDESLTSFRGFAYSEYEGFEGQIGDGGEGNGNIDDGGALNLGDLDVTLWSRGGMYWHEGAGWTFEFDGSSVQTIVGFDTYVGPDTEVGFGLGYEKLDISSDFNMGGLWGHGFSFVPRLSHEVNDTVSIKAFAGYQYVDYESERTGGRRNKVTADYDSNRLFGGIRLRAGYTLAEDWEVGFTSGFSYMKEHVEDYRESDGFAVPDDRVELGQLRLGSDLSYSTSVGAGNVKLFASGHWEYDVISSSSNLSWLPPSARPRHDDMGASFAAGVEYGLNENISFSLSGDTVQFRDDLTEFSFTGGLVVNTDVFGGK